MVDLLVDIWELAVTEFLLFKQQDIHWPFKFLVGETYLKF